MFSVFPLQTRSNLTEESHFFFFFWHSGTKWKECWGSFHPVLSEFRCWVCLWVQASSYLRGKAQQALQVHLYLSRCCPLSGFATVCCSCSSKCLVHAVYLWLSSALNSRQYCNFSQYSDFPHPPMIITTPQKFSFVMLASNWQAIMVCLFI